MRIRSILAGLAIGVGALVLSSPVAFADTNPKETTTSPVPTSTRVRTPVAPSQRPAADVATPEARPAEGTPDRPRIKPKGAPETGAGMEDASSNTGMYVIGGVGLVALAGGGTLAVRRTRKQS
ncbi:hypothetical protein JOF56_003154 [Kibdelosporangium banguiense]|uniref:Gram-positive cocci surface proteins LPxTG domain-containing protein n=1 Tax=Kibdelosporangium banguiense TaxID=1365924 RepID=A0ABS4TED4_9PSEU|nr:hypothetical protein [Kibdelosporangium banguiense]MBP2322769.1 hypothetical protein [Kibdelosporangium banguiense]